ncbi:MAG: iron-containing alcohol dehydrogenase [Bacteroidales bacterium]|nr:iron-containing alcohol dehydrogenase [Bacteroidales bacterium]MCF8352593.1 iron-containing alcohol dehydrogenase [Bacteroidales bacterium]MCF8376845.1 iron-containing alcohol dehydrogenase [Bacteroidales bacterium]MCF8400752.1 iron-containing alcohol dehydrogenase [Bacteroidales bacterium]
MNNFSYQSPTKLVFGKDVVNGLGEAVQDYGRKVLLLYGGGSIKRNGAYNDVMKQMNEIGAEVYEYGGIKSNPLHSDADEAAELGREKKVDLILAVGGGSVIDTAKAVAMTVPVDHSCWEFYNKSRLPQTALPMINVLTLAATGTETNMFTVVQNQEEKLKVSVVNPVLYPKYAFLDPQYTFTVPRNYTAYGITDLVAHSLEVFFGKGESTLSDKYVYAIIKEALEYGPLLLNDLQDYELRAKVMLAATMALNGITMIGKEHGDWGVHAIGHVLSVLYDVPHGASLSVAYPAWLKYHKKKAAGRIAELGQNIFGTDSAEDSIEALQNYFVEIGSPVKLSQLDQPGIDADEILRTLIRNKASGFHYKLDEGDLREIISLFR